MESSPTEQKEPKGAIFDEDEGQSLNSDEHPEDPLRKKATKPDMKTEKHPPATKVF